VPSDSLSAFLTLKDEAKLNTVGVSHTDRNGRKSLSGLFRPEPELISMRRLRLTWKEKKCQKKKIAKRFAF